jgi:SAM-dependent methyltransferase
MNFNFIKYAEIYDELNFDKDYNLESKYILNLIRAFKPNLNSILDLGCGSGKHAMELAKLGFKVVGIDSSAKMIDIAKKNKEMLLSSNPDIELEFFVADALDLKFSEKFDVVLSLFHVMSYQILDESVKKLFWTAYECLVDNGLFIFDYWYKPAVINLKPVNRIKIAESEIFEITRKSTPFIFSDSITEVLFDIQILNKLSNSVENFQENHLMRSFESSEFLIIPDCKFTHLSSKSWMGQNLPTKETWAAVSIYQKLLQ